MKLHDIMTPQVEVIAPNATLTQAAQKMKDLNVGSLPVCDGERLGGMITDRDITVRAIAEGRDPNNTTVEQVMSREVVCCYEDQEVSEAAKIMEDKQIRRLIILDREKKLAGIVSLGDVAVKDRDEHISEEMLERISEPARPMMAGAVS